MAYISEGKRYMLKALGKPWKLQVIDLEQCVYRDFGDYDIEVSGVGGMKRSSVDIYVWDKRDRVRVTERVRDLSVDRAIEICRELETKYGGKA